ncbi:calpain family cysteine protease [Colletotrichum cuscutae]|uniref:Calpain family cysteine protease n=1 Tax=Colletotrichum cuscutae TaxID=1209917 RepID=A0AAI9Y2C5_9PEZI|nr:calpain family cysteine protease [Colletotrichum cuscutae]
MCLKKALWSIGGYTPVPDNVKYYYYYYYYYYDVANETPVEEAPAEEEEVSDSDSDAVSTVLDDEEELTGSPWNAVCVLGLRVYARDPEVSIRLVKPSDAEEASSLIVDGEAAGATA